MGKFINKDTMINSIEGFLEVNKNTTSIIALIKGVPDLFCDVYESMINEMGRKLEGSNFEPFLYIGIPFATFNLSG